MMNEKLHTLGRETFTERLLLEVALEGSLRTDEAGLVKVVNEKGPSTKVAEVLGEKFERHIHKN